MIDINSPAATLTFGNVWSLLFANCRAGDSTDSLPKIQTVPLLKSGATSAIMCDSKLQVPGFIAELSALPAKSRQVPGGATWPIGCGALGLWAGSLGKLGRFGFDGWPTRKNP